ncbi:MAG: Crp/Fnr family transcriptional regulator [Prevotellaceae bacterium]|jgi:CRP-like cAMP-binding protein|nr:Crp/Fnr family transcriptional regulator [Prevotellaceae bacterium]
MDSNYSTLLQLPLFQGLSKSEVTDILGKVQMNFSKHKAGDTLCRQGAPCGELLFILNGTVASYVSSENELYSVTEFFEAPYLIEMNSMFGLDTCYIGTYTARTAVSTVSVSKEWVLHELLEYEIFRLNYISVSNYRVKNYRQRLWQSIPFTGEERIKQFILLHTERPEGEKHIKIKMSTLGDLLNISRVHVSALLNGMQKAGLIELHRGIIVVPDAAKLLA